jgi:hypothetical protein
MPGVGSIDYYFLRPRFSNRGMYCFYTGVPTRQPPLTFPIYGHYSS